MIELGKVTKGWHLGIEAIFGQYYAKGDRWFPLTDEIRDDEVWEEETIHTCQTNELLLNYLQYVPGLETWDDYGDLYAEFNMRDVEEAGWTQAQLTKCLQFIADHINNDGEIVAEYEPCTYEYNDAYGHPRIGWEFGALVPPKGMKTLQIEHPQGVRP